MISFLQGQKEYFQWEKGRNPTMTRIFFGYKLKINFISPSDILTDHKSSRKGYQVVPQGEHRLEKDSGSSFMHVLPVYNQSYGIWNDSFTDVKPAGYRHRLLQISPFSVLDSSALDLRTLTGGKVLQVLLGDGLLSGGRRLCEKLLRFEKNGRPHPQISPVAAYFFSFKIFKGSQ